jgi:uncharacterized membrane protein YeaQ/YmgE (transglycosylase-associated protein family)
MDFSIFATLMVVGLAVGGLTEFVMKDGGYGLVWNLILGLTGSSAANVLVWILGVSPGAGMLATGIVACFGSALVIVGQRKIWPAHA